MASLLGGELIVDPHGHSRVDGEEEDFLTSRWLKHFAVETDKLVVLTYTIHKI